jgi:hypothetical protein
VAGAVADLGNGSYVVPLFVPDGSDLEVKLTLAGDPLFAGTLSQLPGADDGEPAKVWLTILPALLAVALLLIWSARRRRGN